MSQEKSLTIKIAESPSNPHKLNAFIGPWANLKADEKFPRCETCEQRLTPLFQIHLQRSLDLFAQGTPAGFLQTLFCANENCDEFNAMDDVTTDNYSVRLVPDSEPSTLTEGRHASEFAVREILPLKFRRDDSEQPLTDDKLGGIPAWVQDEAYPPCRQCHNPNAMRFVLQITPGEIEGFPFPDGAVIFISQCQRHPDEFRLVWQCT